MTEPLLKSGLLDGLQPPDKDTNESIEMLKNEPVLETICFSISRLLKEDNSRFFQADTDSNIIYLTGFIAGLTASYKLFKAQMEANELDQQWGTDE